MYLFYIFSLCLLVVLFVLFQDVLNIIFMMVDDFGNGDLSYNKAKYDMFSIDFLAEVGVYFECFYIYFGCMFICSVLMIGCYFLWQGFWQVVIGWYDDYCLLQSENWYMLFCLFKEVGYQIVIIGKWYFGYMYFECLFYVWGFDYQFGSSYGLLDYYDWLYENVEDCKENGSYYVFFWYFNVNKYFMDVIVEKCEDYFDSWVDCSFSFFFLFVFFIVFYVVFYGSGVVCLQIFVDSLVNILGSLNII